MHHYRKTSGIFELVDDKSSIVLWQGTIVAICFDKSDGTIHLHGDPDRVVQYYRTTISKYRGAGLVDVTDIADDLVVVRSGAWDPEVLNKCLDITGYVVRMARYYNLKIKPPVGVIADEVATISARRHGHTVTPVTADPDKYPPFEHEILEN